MVAERDACEARPSDRVTESNNLSVELPDGDIDNLRRERNMEAIVTGNIWKQIARKAKGAKRRLIAVAYVSNVRHLKLKRNDVLVCDASDRAIEAGETSARLLQDLFRKGVELRSRPDLHAKIAVFGRYALIGSCNLSLSSEEDLTELALLTDRRQVLGQATAFIHNLRETSQEIGRDFLRRILKIKVRARRRRRRRARQTPRFGSRVWLVSVRELPQDSYPKERPFVEMGEKNAESLVADKDNTISWIRWTGKGRFRPVARPGDLVIQIWQSLSAKRTKVFAPCPVVFKQDVRHWTRFYIAEPEDCQNLSWAQFEKDAKKHGLTRISKNSIRELNPREVLLIERLWK
jgi:hypothetical protein